MPFLSLYSALHWQAMSYYEFEYYMLRAVNLGVAATVRKRLR